MYSFQAKLDARRARRQTEFQRKMEEIEAQRIVAEQKKQMQQNSTGSSSVEANVDNGLLIAPKVNLGESVEEQAVRKAQVSAVRYFVMPITWIWRGQKGGGATGIRFFVHQPYARISLASFPEHLPVGE